MIQLCGGKGTWGVTEIGDVCRITGVWTGKATHIAVTIDTQGTRLAVLSIPANPNGYTGRFKPFNVRNFSECFGTSDQYSREHLR